MSMTPLQLILLSCQLSTHFTFVVDAGILCDMHTAYVNIILNVDQYHSARGRAVLSAVVPRKAFGTVLIWDCGTKQAICSLGRMRSMLVK